MNDTKDMVPAGGGEVTTVDATLVRDPYAGIAAAPFSSEQRAVLGRRLNHDEIEVRPDDGVLYLPGVKCRERLNEAFGIGGWALAHNGNPQVNGTQVFAPMRLYILGRFVAESMGEGKWIANNPKSTYGTALESAKTDALGRCCKDIGVALELWDPKFTREWRARNTQKIKNPDPGRFGRSTDVWVRNDDPCIKKDSPRDATGSDGSPVPPGDKTAKADKVAATGGPSSAAQATLIQELKAQVGGLTDELFGRSIAVYRKADGSRCSLVADLSKDQADHYVKRLQDRIHKQGLRIAEATDSTPRDLKAAIDRPLEDLLQSAFPQEGQEELWLRELFDKDSRDELDDNERDSAHALLLAGYNSPVYLEMLIKLRALGRVL